MQVGSSTALLAQLQALEKAALGQYQGGQDFNFAVAQTDCAAGSGGSAADSGSQLSGSFKSSSLIAVGSMTPDGQMVPFPAKQIQSEENAASAMGQTAFADSLQNFLLLAQTSDPTGQIGSSSYSDHQQFVGDNGLVSATFDSSFSLGPATAGDRTSSA